VIDRGKKQPAPQLFDVGALPGIDDEPEGPIGPSLEELIATRDALIRRLDDGDAKILKATGPQKEAMTDFWIDLLREYELAADEVTARQEDW
jgi:hypothetical protein